MSFVTFGFRFLRGLGKTANIEKLCSITLRSLIETENVATPSSDEPYGVSLHLGHSERMRDEHYVLPDRRQMVQSANRLLFLLEEAGETDDCPGWETAIPESTDPVRGTYLDSDCHQAQNVTGLVCNSNFCSTNSRRRNQKRIPTLLAVHLHQNS